MHIQERCLFVSFRTVYECVSSYRTDGRSIQISRQDETRLPLSSRHTDRPSSGLQVVTRLERDGMSRVGELSLLCSPLLGLCCAATAALPRRRLSSTAASERREGEARGSLAEVKVNLPPAHLQRRLGRRIRQAGRKDNPPPIVVR